MEKRLSESGLQGDADKLMNELLRNNHLVRALKARTLSDLLGPEGTEGFYTEADFDIYEVARRSVLIRKGCYFSKTYMPGEGE